MTKPLMAPMDPGWLEAFTNEVVRLSPRHAGLIDTGTAHWYVSKHWTPEDAAASYVHHRPKEALT